jgi:hypothetical protein
MDGALALNYIVNKIASPTNGVILSICLQMCVNSPQLDHYIYEICLSIFNRTKEIKVEDSYVNLILNMLNSTDSYSRQ